MQLNDELILQALAKYSGGRATYVVRNILDMDHGFKNLKTASVLSRLKRMEREGKVERVPSIYAIMICWKVAE